MDGIIVINKPTGMSSHDCVNRMRKAFMTKKVGHSGTLDKEASGVLVLGINKGTKLLNYLNQDDKAYIFDVRFGQTTNTLDHAGEVTEEKIVESLEPLKDVIQLFKGVYHQSPPDFSSVKVKGKKLYQYALEGKTVPEVEARKITIYDFKQLEPVKKVDGFYQVKLYVKSTKGLYVRKLANDLALKLGTVAHTRSIHRVQAGQFSIEDAQHLDKVDATALISMQAALKDIPAYYPNDYGIKRIQSGLRLNIDSNVPLIKCLDKHDHLLAVYELKEVGLYKPKNVFM